MAVFSPLVIKMTKINVKHNKRHYRKWLIYFTSDIKKYEAMMQSTPLNKVVKLLNRLWFLELPFWYLNGPIGM